ncbi:uncharacterized protein LOC111709939 [Eurytemora carolleeae]|uniref:uncharacterized protein LOC111709939 n=1 Tax=Eurytemora carolleeae TaxID=1294199 RepID=UPI000C77D378|nr:uncharacterized protein LOC111709939 [Eurytemora carolleeae]|eukprot:XP_023339687.1 uncharacterized protein LOC111709939 [Eurytemora affinis]
MDDLTHNVQLCLDSARIHESKIKFTEKNLGFIVKSLIASNTFKELKTVLAIKNQDSPCVIFMEPGGLKVGKINVRRFMYKTFRDPELESKINQWNITCGDVSCINPYHVVFKLTFADFFNKNEHENGRNL